MKCQKCGDEFEESQIDVSHDVPRYIFNGGTRERKQQADKWGRYNLCKKHHDIYEKTVFAVMTRDLPEETKQEMRLKAKAFAKSYFNDGDTNTT